MAQVKDDREGIMWPEVKWPTSVGFLSKRSEKGWYGEATALQKRAELWKSSYCVSAYIILLALIKMSEWLGGNSGLLVKTVTKGYYHPEVWKKSAIITKSFEHWDSGWQWPSGRCWSGSLMPCISIRPWLAGSGWQWWRFFGCWWLPWQQKTCTPTSVLCLSATHCSQAVPMCATMPLRPSLSHVSGSSILSPCPRRHFSSFSTPGTTFPRWHLGKTRTSVCGTVILIAAPSRLIITRETRWVMFWKKTRAFH